MSTPDGGADALTPLDLEILAFERQRWRYAGAKAQAIKDLFGMSETRYFQALNMLIDKPEAVVIDGPLVNRLRRLREDRAAQRRRGVVSTGR